ncbi:MAG: AI-2E family transporter [Alphaproteobacteria bacterium]|nr:AI-2E family transporter [Alphaproteobacteria bacterium]
MSNPRPQLFWFAGLAVMLAALFLLRSVLLPFVAGMAVSYFLDPLADRLERWGASRTLATTLITIAFVLLAATALMIMVPLFADQMGKLVVRIPDYLHTLDHWLRPILVRLSAKLNHADRVRLDAAASGFAGDAMKWLGGLVTELWHEGLNAINILSLIFITPVVTFYLLRDWDRMVASIDLWLPRRHIATIHQIFRDIDRAVAGFVRGQAIMCLTLGTYYALGLTLVGLEVGLVVGFFAGLVSFIPYLGTISGFIISMILAFGQFTNWVDIALVVLVFAIGQVLESYVLQPRLVGRRVHLHPVWLMFSLLAGGALFGFLGVLLAVPIAAVIGVLARFGLNRYLAGPLYQGEGEDGAS